MCDYGIAIYHTFTPWALVPCEYELLLLKLFPFYHWLLSDLFLIKTADQMFCLWTLAFHGKDDEGGQMTSALILHILTVTWSVSSTAEYLLKHC